MTAPASFSVKIAIVQDENKISAPDQGLDTVSSLFTPDLQQNPYMMEQMPNLINLEIINLDMPNSEFSEKINHDYTRLMALLETSTSDTFLIYVRSTTVSAVPANNLIKLIYDLCLGWMESSVDDKEHFDIFYLAKWADRCDQYKIIGTAFNNSVNLVETVNAHGLQSVLISPSGASKIRGSLSKPIAYPVSMALTQLISTDILYALTTTPSVMSFDTASATSSADYVKSHECADIPRGAERPTPQGSNLSLFIFIIIFLIVVAIFYFLVLAVTGPGHGKPPEMIVSTPRQIFNVGTSR